ncbi:MAG: DUF5668 domain-containing protein [Bacteroidales bacterium]|nr:DUF5668 domain-containing protein [Bacteroidales bacterium]
MKYRNVFWGVIFITIGSLFILKNLNIIYFNWYSILRLWPLLLVLWGISILPVKTIMKLILSFSAILIAAIFLISYPCSRTHPFNFWINKSNNNYKNYQWEEQTLTEGYDSSIHLVKLNFDAAAGDFQLNNITNQLLEFDNEGNTGPYKLRTKQINDSKIINLTLEKTIINHRHLVNNAYLKLNPKPLWELNIDVGAAKIDMDLSLFKTKKIDIDAGASSIKIKLGNKTKKIKLDIDAGASSILIKIPYESGCEVQTNTVLSSRDLKGFDKIKKGYYETPNFSDSDNKIFINIDAAVSSLKIKRY